MSVAKSQSFIELIRQSHRGKLKIYIGMIAGVGKTYRMLQEAHELLNCGIDIKIGYVETHDRRDTALLVEGLPIIPRKSIFYKGKAVEEMDIDAIIQLHPEVVIVDELAHTNVEGSRHEKRWQDVFEIIDAGINVITAVNIQHIESLNDDVESVVGIKIRERIPDSVLSAADEVVNIDLTAEDLIDRLKSGKIYSPDKVNTALNNFFKVENILHLREMALKEVAYSVGKKVVNQLPFFSNKSVKSDKLMVVIRSDERYKSVIRKTARLADFYTADWVALYVQLPSEQPDRISLAAQRHLISNFELVVSLGGSVIQTESDDIYQSIIDTCVSEHISLLCTTRPSWVSEFFYVFKMSDYRTFLKKLSKNKIDLITFA